MTKWGYEIMLKLLAVSVVLFGCSHITYIGKPDGSTTAEGWEIGTTTALSGMKFSTDGKVRTVEIDSLNADRVEGMKAFNDGLRLMINGAAKAAK